MQDAQEIVVAASGDIYVGPVGTTLPTTLATPPGTGFANLGYATDDGVTLTGGQEVEDIAVWQKRTPARRIVTARSFQAAFQLSQWSEDNFGLAFGGGSWSVPSSGVYRYDPPADGDELTEYAAVIEWQDGDLQSRIVIPRCTVNDDVETELNSKGAAVLPVTLSALTPDGADRAWYYLSDDAAFAT